MASAMVGSRMFSCQFSMGSWVATIVEASPWRSSMTSRRSLRSAAVMGAKPRSSMMSTLALESFFMILGYDPSPLAMAISWNSCGMRM